MGSGLGSKGGPRASWPVASGGRNPAPALLPQVFRLPVQECLSYAACAECLSSQDPYCGWCVVEGR